MPTGYGLRATRTKNSNVGSILTNVVLKPTAIEAIAIVMSAVCYPKRLTLGLTSTTKLWICKAAA
jgi:hypothetical protein